MMNLELRYLKKKMINESFPLSGKEEMNDVLRIQHAW